MKSKGGHDAIKCDGDPEEPACRWDMDCDEGRKKCINPGKDDAKCEDKEQEVVFLPDKPDGDWCGRIKHDINELIEHTNGCWTANEVHCQGGGEAGDKELPFKHGNDCNGGRIEIPEGVCVDLVPLDGGWEADACSNPDGGKSRVIQKCATDGKMTVDFHKEALGRDKICAWKFSKKDPCLASSTLQLGNTTELVHLIV